MPTPSRLLPVEGYSGLDVVPYNRDNYTTSHQYILENSPLTMTLREQHLHCASISKGLYSLDFQLVTGLWFILKDISRTIQLAANPLLDPFDSLPSTIDPELLEHIGMPSPAILAVENYTQNLLTVTSTQTELCHLFGLAQKIGLDGAQWIHMAREKCRSSKEGFGWDWSENGNGLAYSVTMPKSVNCGYIESIVDDDEPDYSKALILHPTLSTYAQEHPDFDPFTLPDDELSH
jgi:hypothetical protein